MRNIVYAPDYKEKLIRLRNNLDAEYGRNVRLKIFSEINQRIQRLKEYPFLGTSVRAIYGIDCDYYFIHISKNVIFYDVEDKQISILNMYNEREDYLIKFLGNMAKMHEEETQFSC